MLYQDIAKSLGKYLFIFSLLLLVPISVALYFEYSTEAQTISIRAFGITLLISLSLAYGFKTIAQKQEAILYRRESIVTAFLIWIITAILSALPFLLSHTLENPLDALFESVSAITTTGASIFHPSSQMIDGAPSAIIFWRVFLQWLGGLGIVVLFIIVLPAINMGGRFLFETEANGPQKEGLTPRIKETAGILWKLYLALTILGIFLLKIVSSSLSWYQTTLLTLSFISTGGFTTYSDEQFILSHFPTQAILLLLMIVGSLNFSVYFHILKGKIFRLFDTELFLFFVSLILGTFFLTLILLKCPWQETQNPNFLDALHISTFQTIAAQSTTGFAISDYAKWPFAAQIFILLLTFIGGMSGSTTGGMKVIRLAILFKTIIGKIKITFRPETVHVVTIQKRIISDKAQSTVLIFFCVVVGIGCLSTFLFIIDGITPYQAFSLSCGFLNNTGISFGVPCVFLSPFAKLLGIILMILGRLEYFVILVLLVPAFWKNR